MKPCIFLKGGNSPDLGKFRRGEVRKINIDKSELHVERGTLKDVDALENDELIYWLMDRGINPPDRADKADLIKYLIAGKGPREKKKSTKEVKEDV